MRARRAGVGDRVDGCSGTGCMATGKVLTGFTLAGNCRRSPSLGFRLGSVQRCPALMPSRPRPRWCRIDRSGRQPPTAAPGLRGCRQNCCGQNWSGHMGRRRCSRCSWFGSYTGSPRCGSGFGRGSPALRRRPTCLRSLRFVSALWERTERTIKWLIVAEAYGLRPARPEPRRPQGVCHGA